MASTGERRSQLGSYAVVRWKRREMEAPWRNFPFFSVWDRNFLKCCNLQRTRKWATAPENCAFGVKKNAIRSSGEGLLKEERGQRKKKNAHRYSITPVCWEQIKPAGQAFLAKCGLSRRTEVRC